MAWRVTLADAFGDGWCASLRSFAHRTLAESPSIRPIHSDNAPLGVALPLLLRRFCPGASPVHASHGRYFGRLVRVTRHVGMPMFDFGRNGPVAPALLIFNAIYNNYYNRTSPAYHHGQVQNRGVSTAAPVRTLCRPGFHCQRPWERLDRPCDAVPRCVHLLAGGIRLRNGARH